MAKICLVALYFCPCSLILFTLQFLAIFLGKVSDLKKLFPKNFYKIIKFLRMKLIKIQIKRRKKISKSKIYKNFHLRKIF
ncbi:hypothetical protein BpHYR1_018467 [Brachionus plicatilis]|uniref:Uncharacterized protein n=1 Tax=Brachionus plicatilis TaxID=10195 RepID=A0A3M7Q3F7_BRAPC|nr:hypothetical protein BpHYR1_018467 [Brachionus plicatilis]